MHTIILLLLLGEMHGIVGGARCNDILEVFTDMSWKLGYS